MLSKHKKVCKKCLFPKYIYALGMCSTCYWSALRQSPSKKNTPESLVNQTSNPAALPKLQDYFEYHLNNSLPKCDNCGEDLHYSTQDIAISCQAHILPKVLFPSVMTHIDNHLTLGGLYQPCKCHDRYDSNWSNAQKMPVFKLAIERFLIFKDFIDPAEVKKLPNPFYNLYHN